MTSGVPVDGQAAQSEFAIATRHRETIRTARYHFVGETPESARHLCFVLHGYGQLAARILRHFDGIIPSGVCVIAPEALNRFYTAPLSKDGSHMQRVGATWLTREDREHEIADAIQWLDLVHREVTARSEAANAPATSVIGFSQGVATAIRWMMLGEVRPTHFVIWAGSLATDMDQEDFGRALATVSTTVVCGTQDEFITPDRLEALSAHLVKVGIEHDVLTFDGTHTLNRSVLQPLLADIVATHAS
jgi:predicted esterase